MIEIISCQYEVKFRLVFSFDWVESSHADYHYLRMQNCSQILVLSGQYLYHADRIIMVMHNIVFNKIVCGCGTIQLR